MDSTTQLSVSCVIPAYNEEENIERVVRHIIPVLQKSPLISTYELILVDDNSKDATGAIIDNFAGKDPHIHAVHRKDTSGFGNAIKAGLAVASCDVIIPVMGDLSDDPEDIVRLVSKIHEGYDVVYGSRFIEGGRLHGYPFPKYIANRSFNNLLRLLFGIPHTDITNAFKAYRRCVIDELGVENLEASGFDLTAELPLKAYIAGFSSAEIPVSWYDRTAGKANLKLSQNATVYGSRLIQLFFSGIIIALRDLFGSIITKSKTGILLSLLLGIVIVLLVVSLSGLSVVVNTMSSVNPVFVVLSGSSVIIGFLFRLWRWRVIYRASGYVVPRTSLFRAMMFGWMLNYILPGRIGDISRAFVLKGTDNVPAGLSLGTVVVERIYDLCTLSLFLGVCGIIVGQKIWYLQAIIGLLVLIMISGLIILLYGETLFSRICPGRMDIILASIQNLRNGILMMTRNYWAMALSCILSIFVWIFECGSLFFAAQALHFDISFVKTTLAGIGGYIVSSLPVTPGAAGLYELSVSGGFSLFGIDFADGVTIALLDHAIRMVIILSIGFICMIQIGFQLRNFFKKRNNLV